MKFKQSIAVSGLVLTLLAMGVAVAQSRPPLLSTGGGVTLDTAQTITGAKTLSGGLTSSGATTISGALDLTGAVSDSGGNITLNDAVDVSGMVKSSVAADAVALQLETKSYICFDGVTQSKCLRYNSDITALAMPDVSVQGATVNGNLTIGSSGNAISGSFSGSAALNFASAAAGACSAELTITVTGAADGDPVMLGIPNASETAGSQFTARVSATNTVSVKHCCTGAGPCDPASGTFKARVIK